MMTNKTYRHHAYREYIKYIHGLLEKNNRKWPDPDGNHTGYKPGSDEVEDVV